MLTPAILGTKLRMVPRDLGRWFKRTGNGDGQILHDVARVLKTSVLKVRASVAPENLSTDDLKRLEEAVLDDIRANIERYPEPAAFAKEVRAKLAFCRAETRREVLTAYARERANQGAALQSSVRAVADAAAAVGTTDYEEAPPRSRKCNPLMRLPKGWWERLKRARVSQSRWRQRAIRRGLQRRSSCTHFTSALSGITAPESRLSAKPKSHAQSKTCSPRSDVKDGRRRRS